MLKTLHSFLGALLLITCLPLAAQTPTYDELSFEADSTTSSYRASGKNHVLIRSKRGNSGLGKTAVGNAITSAEVTEIVLVFTETDPSAIAEREEANRERWENLLMTYPEYFQYSTTYKNVCQCNAGGDAEAFKKSQGFYVYINGEVPKVEEAKAPEAPPAPEAKPAAVEPPAAPKTVKGEEPPAAPKPVAEVKKPEEKKAAPAQPETIDTPAPKAAPEPVAQKEAPAAVSSQAEEPSGTETEAPKSASKRKPAGAKARKAKNPKACRPACYEGGDEDLIAFFKSSMPLTKKQRKKAKNVICVVKIQLDIDGSIKKTMVTGENETFNKMAEDAIKSMNPWNAAVKNGVAVRSEVKFMLKFDKETKSMKPNEILVNPKPGPKCKCATDSEIFGS